MDINNAIKEIIQQIRQPVWDKWYLKERLGTSASGAVYRAEAKLADRIDVSAIKIICITDDNRPFNDEETRYSYIENKKRSLENEFAAMRELRGCGNIAAYEEADMRPLYINGVFEGYYFLIRTELLTCVSDLIRNRHIDCSEENILNIAGQIGRGIKAAHDIGIIHGNINPNNIFMLYDGIYKLGDFGISKQSGNAGASGYLSPEVFYTDQNPYNAYSKQTDIYSFGICLYQFMNNMLFPFEEQTGDQETALNIRMQGNNLPAPKNASVPFSRIILRACAFNQNERYFNIDEMLYDLENIRSANNIQPGTGAPGAYMPPGFDPNMNTAAYADNIPQDMYMAPYNQNMPIAMADINEKSGHKTAVILSVSIITVLLAAALIIFFFVFNDKSRKDSTDKEFELSDSIDDDNGDSGDDIRITDSTDSNTLSIAYSSLEPSSTDQISESEKPTETAVTTKTTTTKTTTQTAEMPDNEIKIHESTQNQEKEISDFFHSIKEISASSQNADEEFSDAVYTYTPWNTVDTDLSTCWCEGVDGYGAGEFITIKFDDVYRLNEICIWNGLCRSEELYYKNGRVRGCTFVFSDGSSFSCELSDGWKNRQNIIRLPDNTRTSYVKIIIDSVYEGNKYSDTCISEITIS